MNDLVEVLDRLNKGITLSKEEIKELIDYAETKLSGMTQIEVPLKNYFSKDVYAREVDIPRGSLLIGKIHRFQNLNIISQGDISIMSIDGVMRVQAPYTVVSSPGVKRLVFAHEDTVWTTIHGTSETDVEKIEEHFIAKSYEELE